MKEKIDNLLKKQRKTKVDLSIKLGITQNGLQNKIANDTFKHNEILQLEEFFGVEKGYFDTVTEKKPVVEDSINYKEKYIELLETTNRLWQLVSQNGIKVNFKFVIGLPRVSGYIFLALLTQLITF